MASQADETSPPRSDLVVKTRRQSTLLDSPSRLTRSQSRRLSSAPLEAPMSPLPSVTTRRRSVRVSESLNDAASQDDVASVQDEAEPVKPIARSRRSTRRSFAETIDEEPVATRGTKLTSIEEDSKPVTRRTRASLKPQADTDQELNLPTTRRTRRSSVSSVNSVSTIASNVSPKGRRTRSQKNLSPVPSPSFSEASALSEIPEVSPSAKKSPLPAKEDGSSSNNITPVSAVSPAKPSPMKSATPLESCSVKGISPMSKRDRTSLSAPRQLQLEESGAPKRASLNNAISEIDQTSQGNGFVITSEDVADLKSRRSRRSSLTPSKFVESPLEDSSLIVQQRDVCDASVSSSREDQEVSEVSGQAELNSSRRKSSARNSLSKSPGPEEISQAADQPELNSSKRKSTGWKSPGPELISEIVDQSELNLSKRKSTGRRSLSKSPGPEEISEVADQPELNSSKRKSTGRLSLSKSPGPDKPSEVAEQPEQTSFNRKSGERFSLSKSTDHASPSKESSGRFSLSSVKSPAPGKCSGDSTLLSVKTPELRRSLGDSIGKQLEFSEAAPEVEKISRGSTGRVSLSSAKSPELDKSCKDSTGNISSPSIKTPELERSQRYSGRFSKAQCFEVDESQETRRCSLTSVKSLDSEAPKRNSLSASPAKSANEHDVADYGSLACEASESPLHSADTSQRLSMSKSDQALRKSFGRQSMSSVKSSPGFSLKFNVTPLDDSGSSEEPSEGNETGEGTESASAFSNLTVPNSTLRRASTGNLALKKTIELENKSKQRASTGSAFSRSSMKLDDGVHVKEAISNSLNSSKQSSGSLNDSSKIDEPELVASEELRLSPIKQDQSDFKGLTLTPSSSDDSYVEIVNNPLEKSTVFNDVSFDSQSAPSESLSHEKPSEEPSPAKAVAPNLLGAGKRASINEKVLDFLHGADSGSNEVVEQTSKSKRASIKRMSSEVLDTQEADSDLEVVLDECTKPKRTSIKRKSFEVSVQADSDVEVVSEPSSKLKRTSLKRMSSEVLQISPVGSGDEEAAETSEPTSKSKTLCKSDKVYKAAARMLNGDMSDFNDTDSDDNQWQLVFSPATKSKKELRKERKQQKKAAKLAKKKNKDERLALMDSAQKANDQDIDVSARNEHEGENVPVNKDTISLEIDVLSKDDAECVEGKKRKSMDVEQQSSAKKRKSLEKKNACLPLELEVPSVNSPDSIVVPQISPEETVGDSDCHSSSEKKIKKKKQNCPDNVDELEMNLLDGANKKKKKKKLKKILSEDIVEEKDLGDTDSTPVEKKLKKKALKSAQTESVEVKKKKKKLGSTTESEPTDGHDSGPHSSAEKKKKLKGIDGELVPKKKKLKNTVAGTVEKTQKMKDTEFEPLDTRNAADSENIPSESKKKKKLKKQTSSVIPGLQENGTLGIDVDEPTEVGTKKLKKKKKKPLIEMPSSGNQIAEVDVEASSEASIRKRKKQKKEKNSMNVRAAVELVEAGAGSDSDDAPTSVSFESGKRAALYEMQAAAESVKKREKELEVVGRQKEKYQKERKRAEKLAKMQRMEERKKRQMQFEGFTENAQYSKNYFTNDGIQKPQNPKAPKRLPVDVLESLSEQPLTKLVKHSDGFTEKSDISAILKAKEEKLEKKRQEKRLALKLKKKKLRESDYIPLDVLGSTRFGVVPLRNVMLAKKIEQNKLAEEATNFRQQNLYGNRIRRTPILSMLAEKEKLKASGKHRLVACANSK